MYSSPISRLDERCFYRRVAVRILCHSDETEYVYEKQLPEDVDKSKSKVKVH